MKKNKFLKFTYIIFLTSVKLSFCQVSPSPYVDWSKIGQDLSNDLEKNEIERQNKRLYYENLKNQSINNIYGATNSQDYINCKSFVIRQIFYNGQQEFVKTINDTYFELTKGRLHPNVYVNNINSYNSQFLNFANSLIMVSNRVNEIVNKNNNLNEIEQKINSVYNNNMIFKIDTYQIQLKLPNNQLITFNKLIFDIINSIN